MTQFRIPSRLLNAAALFASTDQARFVLNGIRVEIHGQRVLLVATDGRRLIVINATEDVNCLELAPGANEAEFIIPTGLWPLPKCGKEGLIVTADEKRIEIIGGERIVSAAPIVANYPKWRQVIPTGQDVSMPCLKINGGLLNTFFKVPNIINPKANGGLRISQKTDDNCPYIIKPEAGSNWLGVLMPVSSNNTGDLPLWLTDEPKPATES